MFQCTVVSIAELQHDWKMILRTARRLKREGEVVVDANSDGASAGEVTSVPRRGPGSQLSDSGDNTGHRVVEVLVACRLQDALFHVLAERP